MMKSIEPKTKEISLPFSAACRVCRNNLHDVCVEDCAVYKDFKHFELDMKLNVLSLPRFTLKEYQELPGVVKGEFLAFYLIKSMEVLYGNNGSDINHP
jgi:hypothetical protein